LPHGRATRITSRYAASGTSKEKSTARDRRMRSLTSLATVLLGGALNLGPFATTPMPVSDSSHNAGAQRAVLGGRSGREIVSVHSHAARPHDRARGDQFRLDRIVRHPNRRQWELAYIGCSCQTQLPGSDQTLSVSLATTTSMPNLPQTS
jgi:hypothetical protein